MEPQLHQTPAQIAAMVMAVLATFVVAIALVRYGPGGNDRRGNDRAGNQPAATTPDGVLVRITAGEFSIAHQWPQLALAIEPGESMDEAVPAGPFELDATIRFRRGRVQDAWIGALVQGGSIIIIHESEVLLSDVVDQGESRIVMTTTPIHLSKAQEELRYIFRSDANGPVRLESMWQPIDAEEPIPLPVSGGSRNLASH